MRYDWLDTEDTGLTSMVLLYSTWESRVGIGQVNLSSHSRMLSTRRVCAEGQTEHRRWHRSRSEGGKGRHADDRPRDRAAVRDGGGVGKEGRRAFQGQGRYARHSGDETECRLEQRQAGEGTETQGPWGLRSGAARGEGPPLPPPGARDEGPAVRAPGPSAQGSADSSALA